MKHIVLNSGGIDSATCIAFLMNKYKKNDVIPVFINYGQRHIKEKKSADNVAQHYGLKNIYINLEHIFENGNNKITDQNANLNKTFTNGIIDTYVPFRNGLFISVIASYFMNKYDDNIKIYFSTHQSYNMINNKHPYADCSNQFVKKMNSVIKEGTYNKVSLKAPFINMTKTGIVDCGLKLNVPFELTWSCYKGNNKPCGICDACKERQRSFAENNATDPII